MHFNPKSVGKQSVLEGTILPTFHTLSNNLTTLPQIFAPSPYLQFSLNKIMIEKNYGHIHDFCYTKLHLSK